MCAKYSIPKSSCTDPVTNPSSWAPGASYTNRGYPVSKVHGANMGPTWVRQDPGGPHVGPMNLALWDSIHGLKGNLIKPPSKLGRGWNPTACHHDGVIKWKHILRYWPFVRELTVSGYLTKASGAELWCFFWSAPEPKDEQTMKALSRSLWRHCNDMCDYLSMP